jgi:hypothetical protein
MATVRAAHGFEFCKQLVRNLDEFYGAFGVGATDELWLEARGSGRHPVPTGYEPHQTKELVRNSPLAARA